MEFRISLPDDYRPPFKRVDPAMPNNKASKVRDIARDNDIVLDLDAFLPHCIVVCQRPVRVIFEDYGGGLVVD